MGSISNTNSWLVKGHESAFAFAFPLAADITHFSRFNLSILLQILELLNTEEQVEKPTQDITKNGLHSARPNYNSCDKIIIKHSS